MNTMTPEELNAMPLEARFRLFVQWLGNQPEDGQYDYLNIHNCALCRFAKSIHFDPMISAGTDHVSFGLHAIEMMPKLNGRAKHALNAGVFGEAYDRLAAAAGLPTRAQGKRRVALVRLLARVIRHKHPLAA